MIVLGLHERADAAARARAHCALELLELLDHPGRVELGRVGHERDRALDQAGQGRALRIERAVGAEIGDAAFALSILVRSKPPDENIAPASAFGAWNSGCPT